MGKYNRAARAARTLVAFFDAVCQKTTRKFQIYGYSNNVNTQQQIFHSLYLITPHSYQSSFSVIC